MPPTPANASSVELLERLIDRGVEFVVVGGVAAVLHGSSLLTVDLDLCIPFSAENLSRLLPLLVELDARFRAHPERPHLLADVERFSSFRLLLLETSLGPVDFLREITGVGDFEAVSRSSLEVRLGNLRCHVLSLEALITAKRATGRDKDLRVLAELEATLRLRGPRQES